MKRNILKSILCIALVLILAAMPICALASSKTAKILKVNVDKARLREGGNGSVITTLDRGTKVLYLDSKRGAYCKVCTTSGKVGYIYKEFLSEYGAIRKDQVYLTADATTLYRRSGNSLRKSSKLKSGQFLLVYQTNGSWAYVKTMSGKSGYVKKSALHKVF